MPRTDRIETPHGRCVIVELDDDGGPLVGDEQAIAAQLSPIRRREFVAGRTAVREALGISAPIIADDRGAPIMPAGWVGSISHKGPRAAAIVAPVGQGFIGVDLETAAPSRQAIERRILTERELALVREPREVTLRFAIKEAIYKAIDPMVRRYVAFTEVELELAVDGSCEVCVVDPLRLPVSVEAWWQERAGFWLATARARPR